MITEILLSNSSHCFQPLDDFLESLEESRFTYYATELLHTHTCNNKNELDNAIKRATEVCRLMNVPLEENFKIVYRSEAGNLVQDWKLTPLAYCLALINSDCQSPVVARMQYEMVKRLLNL